MGFNGARIALLEARKSDELASIIRNSGGVPVQAPAVREEKLECAPEVEGSLDRMFAGEYEAIVFLTGVGASTFLDTARSLGREPELLDLLSRIITVCRGPKPSAVLKKNEIHITASPKEPFTTTELADTMRELPLGGKRILIVNYGERSPAFEELLRETGIGADSLCLYEWRMPEDLNPLRALVSDIIAGSVDAVAFTSQVQVRHLFQVADEARAAAQLRDGLNGRVTVASIGPTCTACLESYGVTPRVVPEHPRMGYMVHALREYFERLNSSSG